jgi:hypothetical protein
LGCTDERLNYQNFGNQPSSLIFQYLSAFEEARRNEINQNSITQAIFASGIFNGFAGKDNKNPVRPEDLVPFPDLLKSDTPKVFSQKTFNMIIRLMKDNKVPPPVCAFLHQLPEVQQRLIADGRK